MTHAHYRCWIFPAHRILSQAILASYRCKSRRVFHVKREPQQLELIACK